MKYASKILALILAAVMMFSVSGCKEVTEESGSQASADNSDFKVGVIHITSKDDTSGYTYAHQSGILQMQKELGLSDDQLYIVDNISDTDVTATNNAIQQCVDEGCTIIFATSFNYMNSMEEYAEKYPNIYFSHCSGYKSNSTNFNNYFGRIYEARYLAGIAAGMKTKTNKIGFVAAMDTGNSEVTGGINAFALGIQSVNPDAQVYVKVTGSWYSPADEKAAAEALIAAGCDVLGQHCDSPAVQKAAQDAGVWGCGYNSDMTSEAPEAQLCSPIWHWGVYYTQAVKAAMNSTWTAKNYYEGMNVGLVDISPLNTSIAAAGTQEAIDAAKAKIISGELFVFSGPIIKNDGTTVIGAGEKLTDEQITGQINYYIKGVQLL